jgi:hypothetical protein
MPKTPAANTLFYGYNLAILRGYIDDESVDPPMFRKAKRENVEQQGEIEF